MRTAPCDTYVVQINVGATVVRQDKIPDRVRALNWVLVAIEGIQEPRVLGGDEFTRLFIRPELKQLVSTQFPGSLSPTLSPIVLSQM